MGMMDMVRRSVLLSALHKATEGPAASLSFSTDAVVSLPSVVADIAPAQSGSGDPSPDNIRAITGTTGLTLTHTDGDVSSTISVDWTDDAGTVYCGTLDVTTGKLTATHSIITMDGTEAWSKNGDTCRLNPTSTRIAGLKGDAACVCNMFKNGGNTYTPKNGEFGWRNTGDAQFGSVLYLAYRLDGITNQSSTAWKNQVATWLENGTPLVVMLKYMTPREYTLTPNRIKPFLGQNSMSINTGDSLTVSYWQHN